MDRSADRKRRPFCMPFRAKRYLLPLWNMGHVSLFGGGRTRSSGFFFKPCGGVFLVRLRDWGVLLAHVICADKKGGRGLNQDDCT